MFDSFKKRKKKLERLAAKGPIYPLHVFAALNWHRRIRWMSRLNQDEEVKVLFVNVPQFGKPETWNINRKTDTGVTPLHVAAWENSSKAATALIECDADVHAKDETGRTSLHVAAYKNACETADLLIDEDADVRAEDNNKRTPLHFAAQENACETAKLLIAEDAIVSVKDSCGGTPLHDAAAKSAIGVAELLIDHGADVKEDDNNKNTPLHYVAKQDSPEAGQLWDLLIAHGADMDAMNEDGDTPATTAEARKEKTERAKRLRPGGILDESVPKHKSNRNDTQRGQKRLNLTDWICKLLWLIMLLPKYCG